MTSIAVTASICASASEAALLVASFMPNSLDLGISHRGLRRPGDSIRASTRNTPRRIFALTESPLSEYRPCQNRMLLRRDFDSRVAGLCARDDVFEAMMLIQPVPRGMIGNPALLTRASPINDQETWRDHGPHEI